jgi:hypothetical protein
MSRRSDRLQARAEAQLKYGPQADALTQILSGLHSELRTSVAQAKAGAALTAHAAQKAIPVAKAIYRAGLHGNTPQQKLVQAQLQGLPSSSPFAAAVQIGTSGANARIRESRTSTLSELVSRKTDAPVARQAEIRGLRSQYMGDRDKALQQLQSLAGESGLYSATRYGQLRKDAAGRALTKRGQNITAGNSKQTADDSS